MDSLCESAALLTRLRNPSTTWYEQLFIPIVNLVAVAIIFIQIADQLGKPNWTGLLILVPFIHIAYVGYLAYYDTP